MRDVSADQEAICRRFGADYVAASSDAMLGVAAAVGSGLLPLNGLRHPPEHDTCGWYLWAGEELSDAPDFFQPLHLGHLAERCPEVLPYLGLAPGWRFLVADGHEDVWYDASLVAIGPASRPAI
jgi:hypothetical protein